MSMNSKFGGLLACLLIAGCGGSNAERDFLCPAQTGSPCTSITEADGSLVGGGQSVRERGADTLADGLTQQPLMTGKGGKAGVSSGVGDGGFSYDAIQYRLPEKVGTLWVAPHSEGGALYESTYIHFLIMPAEWGDRP